MLPCYFLQAGGDTQDVTRAASSEFIKWISEALATKPQQFLFNCEVVVVDGPPSASDKRHSRSANTHDGRPAITEQIGTKASL